MHGRGGSDKYVLPLSDVKESAQPLLPVYSSSAATSSGSGAPGSTLPNGTTSAARRYGTGTTSGSLSTLISKQRRVLLLIVVLLFIGSSYWRRDDGFLRSPPHPASHKPDDPFQPPQPPPPPMGGEHGDHPPPPRPPRPVNVDKQPEGRLEAAPAPPPRPQRPPPPPAHVDDDEDEQQHQVPVHIRPNKLGGEPPPPKVEAALPREGWYLPAIEDAGLPILPEENFIQPRRELKPSWPNPWSDFDTVRRRVDPYMLLKSRTEDDGTPVDMQDPPKVDRPPARLLAKAFEWAAQSALAGITSRDPKTGRPLMVPEDALFLYSAEDFTPPDLDLDTLHAASYDLPRVQTTSWPIDRVEEQRQRRVWVKRAFLHAWEGYKAKAWGHDELKPVTGGFGDNYNGWGATIVDNLDTLLIMGLPHEYELARKHVEQIDFSYLTPSAGGLYTTSPPNMADFEPPKTEDEDDEKEEDDVAAAQARRKRIMFGAGAQYASPTTLSWFETLIRYLGGMLSAYDLAKDPLMLTRAKELGDWLLPALSTKYGLPINRYTLGHNPRGQATGRVSLAEVGTLSLELTKLSLITGDPKYFHSAQRAMDTLDEGFGDVVIEERGNVQNWRKRLGALLTLYVDPDRPNLSTGEYAFGGLADSYYEYLVKQHQLLKGKMSQYGRMYRNVAESVWTYLYHRIEVVPGRRDLATIGSVRHGNQMHDLEHLTCFAGGMFGLGAKLLEREEDMDAAANITNACAWMYESSATGCGPESIRFFKPDESARFQIVDNPDGAGKVRKPRGTPVIGVAQSNSQYIGRPEAIESVFYMYRLTGDRAWQDQGWKMFTSWIEASITQYGFATVANVHFDPSTKVDSQESFVLAETLKYYYLLFSEPDLISLDEYVFNTEAHPFRIPTRHEPAPLWSAPETDDSHEALTKDIGQGTPVQLWFRVQQAAAVSRAQKKALKNPGRQGNLVNRPVPVGLGGPAAGRRVKPIPPAM